MVERSHGSARDHVAPIRGGGWTMSGHEATTNVDEPTFDHYSEDLMALS